MEELKNQIQEEIAKIEELKNKTRELMSIEKQPNPFVITRFEESKDFSIHPFLKMTMSYKDNIPRFYMLPGCNTIAVCTEKEFQLFSVPFVSGPSSIPFPSPTHKVANFAAVPSSNSIIAHFNTGEVSVCNMKDKVWQAPIKDIKSSVNIQASESIIMLQYPPNNLILKKSSLDPIYDNSFGNCQILSAELAQNDPYVIILNERNEIYIAYIDTTNNTPIMQKKIDGNFLISKMSLDSKHIVFMNNDSLVMYNIGDDNFVNQPLKSYGIAIDQNFILSIENIPEKNSNALMFYDIITMKRYAKLEITDDSIEGIQTSLQRNTVLVALTLKSKRIAFFDLITCRRSPRPPMVQQKIMAK